MQTNAKLAEAEIAEGRFAAFDEREAIWGDFRAVRKARREASGGGTVPSGEASALGEEANFCFMQSGIEKRSEDAVFRCSAMAGAEIQGVVSVDAIRYSGEPTRLRHAIEYGEQLILAEIAAIRRVRAVAGIFHFVGCDKFMAQAEITDKIFDHGAVMRGIAWGKRRHGQRPRAQGGMRGPSEIGGIRASRKSNDHGRELGELLSQLQFFFGR